VPLVGAAPKGVALNDNTLRRVPDNHGNLQRNPAALDELEGVLRAKPIIAKGDLLIPLSVTVPTVVAAGEALAVEVAVDPGNSPALRATVRAAGAHQGSGTTRPLTIEGGRAVARFDDLRPGGYVVDVAGATPGSPVAPVSAATLVFDAAAS